MAIEQIRVGFDNFSYIIYCPNVEEAAVVDPGYDASKALEFISSKNLELEYIINTHYHNDHSGEGQRVKNSFPSAEIVASEIDGTKLGVKVDVIVSNGNHLKLGEISLDFLLTPGHTPGGICIIVDDEALLTGDTLFIGDCGRTDLPGGSPSQMYRTLHEKIMPLPDHLIVYPGHDYGDKPFDTLGNQKQTNKTLLAKNFEEFSKIP
ncbi:MAG: MBL fold metallo-hydrolase [Thermoplasmatales archaeon]|nr:MAG: MBL fold metallo-hydrolase [Thermoplasmatales archaeon]